MAGDQINVSAESADQLDPEDRAWLSSISPHFTRADLGAGLPSEEVLIQVFADRVWGWQLDVADRLIKTDEHAGFAVLSIVMSYFEMIGKHLRGFEGTGESKAHFRIGFDAVVGKGLTTDQADRIAERLYGSVRNGMYHDALTSAGIALARHPEDARVLHETRGVDGTVEIVINPERLIGAIRRHFAAYVTELLREPKGEARKAFITRFRWVDGSGRDA